MSNEINWGQAPKGEQWTHTCSGDKCRVLIDKPDCGGYVVILVDGDGYNIAELQDLKPIKPTISKAEAWDKLAGHSDLNDVGMILEKYEVV